MKRLFSVLLVAVLCCGVLAGCSGGKSNSDEIEKLKKENEQLKAEVQNLKNTDKVDVKEEKEQNIDGVPELILNEPFEVKTENGTYKVTVQGAMATDWYRGSDEKSVIALKYEVENVDFEIGELLDGKDGCLIDRYAFKVSTPDGYVLDVWNSTMSEYGFPEIVEPGFKSKEELPYIVDEIPEYINVILCRGTGDIAKIKLNIE